MQTEKGVFSGTEMVLKGAFGSEARMNFKVTLFSIGFINDFAVKPILRMTNL